MASGKPVDAVIAADAFTSLAVYNVLRKHNIAVPEQVSIISFDTAIKRIGGFQNQRQENISLIPFRYGRSICSITFQE